MPVFTIELPNGKRIDAEADNEDAAISGAQEWYKQQQPEKTDTSLVSAVQQGGADLVRGVGSTIKNLISKDTGTAIENAAAAKSNPKYKSAYEEFANPSDGADKHVLGVDWSSAPRALLEQAPALATDLATQMVLKRFGPLAQVAGGMLTYGARSAGNEIQKRADARTGETGAEPTTEDKVVGVGSTALQGALNTYGANKIVNPAKVTGTGLKGVTQTAGNVAKAAAAEGVTNGAQEAISEAASTAGTDKGLTTDTQAIKAAALMGGIGGGVFGGARGVKDGAAAVRFRDLGGDLTPASAAAANRLIEKAGSAEALQSPSKAFDAVTDTHSDVMRELSQATSAFRKMKALPVDADNALARAANGRNLSDRDLNAIDAIDGGDAIKDLAKQATALAGLKNQGTFDVGGERFSGGIAERTRHFIKNNPLLSGGMYTGGNAMAVGLDGLSSAITSHALPAIGVYAGTRAVERALGITSPARTFAEKFSDNSTSVRPRLPPYEPSQSPTGPKVAPTQSLTTPQPWGPALEPPKPFKPDIVEPGLRKIVGKLEQTKRQQLSKDAMPLLRQLAAQRSSADADAQRSSDHQSREHDNSDDVGDSEQSPYSGLSDAEVRTKAVEDAVGAGIIPDVASARERYGQGVQRKRDAIREAVHKAANSDGYTDTDVEAFQPFFRRLLLARTREEAQAAVQQARPRMTSKAHKALMRHVGSEFINRTWKK